MLRRMFLGLSWLAVACLLTLTTINCGQPVCEPACTGGRACINGECQFSCPDGQVLCGEKCVDTNTDNANCGACGTSCSAGENCSNGACAVTCPAGQDNCGGKCFNLQTSPTHCGACGTACGNNEVCNAGSCSTSCATGLTDCSGACINTMTDNANCGACGTTCAAGEVCNAGTCALNCAASQTNCGGVCTDTMTDDQNCGTCGTACVAGQVCTAGSCVAGCADEQTDCGGTCVDLMNDRNNCGTCGTNCAAGQICNNGACEISCPMGQTGCGGACVDTMTDNNNCGTCGTTCMGGELCDMGSCKLRCSAGLTGCSGSCVDTQTDDTNCGTCGNACPMGQVCSSGTCEAPCPNAGEVRCSGTCVSLASDFGNCGACNSPCSLGESCNNGVCQGPCTPSELQLSITLPSSAYSRRVRYAKNGAVAYVAGSNDVFYAYNTRTGRQLYATPLPDWGYGFDIDASGVLAVTANYTRDNISIIRLSDGKLLSTINSNTNTVYDAAISPDGTMVAAVGSSGQARLHKVGDGSLIANLDAETGTSTHRAVTFSPDNKFLAVGGSNREVYIIDLATNKQIRTLTGHTSTIYDIAYSPDNRVLASVGASSQIRLWNTADGSSLTALTTQTGTIYGVAWSADSTKLITTSSTRSNYVQIWDIPNNYMALGPPINDHSSSTWGAAWSPDGRNFASVSSDDTLKIYGCCKAGEAFCGSVCAKLDTTMNCGRCGNTCAMGEFCTQGQCLSSCPGGQARCGDTCIDTNSDAQNCGGCGNVCTGLCVNGSCQLVCSTGEQVCNGKCTNTTSSLTDCGGCGMACMAGQFCVSGACVSAPVGLVLQEFDPGNPDYVAVRNTTMGALSLGNVFIYNYDTSINSPDDDIALPSQQLAANTTVYIIESGRNRAGEIDAGESIGYVSSSDFTSLLCFGRCDLQNGANVLDALVVDQPSAGLPGSLTFMGGGVSNVSGSNAYQRTAYMGAPPTFLNADWTTGASTRP